MTKISNAGSNIWNLLEQPAVSKSEDRKQIRDVVPELKGRQINEKFGGQKAPELSLPEGYEAKLTGTLKKSSSHICGAKEEWKLCECDKTGVKISE